MGYYTDFELTIKSDTVKVEDFKSKVEEVSEYTFDTSLRGPKIWSVDEIKWYSFQEDIIDISKHFPDALIEVEGVGEERDDHWRMFAKNGKTEYLKPIITWPQSNLETEFLADLDIHKVLSGED